jgi:hypothetical protein
MQGSSPSSHRIALWVRMAARAWAALALACAIGLAAFPAISMAAAQVQGSSVAVHSKLPVARPDFPVPTDRNTVFYVQRSSNSNTVVYTLNFRADGTLDPRQPVKAFWRRFNTTGERKDLGFLEARMAYGVSARKTRNAGEFTVSFVALPNRKVTLRQSPDKSVDLTIDMGEHTTRLVYAYVEINESGLVPKVDKLTLYGIDTASQKAIVETIRVGGAEIRG